MPSPGTTGGRVRIYIEGDSSDLERAVRSSNSALSRLGVGTSNLSTRTRVWNSIADQQRRNLSALASGFGYATAGAVAFAGYGLAKATRDGIEFNAQMESNQLALKGFLGSGREAQAFLDDLYETAKRTPFEFTDLTSASRRLLAFGLDAQKTQRLLMATGDAVAAMGGDAENIDRVTLALGQMQAKGKVSAEELLQLTEAGIPAYQILKEELGLTGEQVANIGNEGIKADEAIAALTRGMEERFGGAAAKQAKTWAGMTSTMQDNWAQMTGAITKDLFEDLKRWAPAVNDTMEDITRVWNRKDLSFEEKVQRSIDQAELNLGPIWDELEGKLDRADIGKRVVQGVEWAIPRIAENAGELGVEVTKGLAKGFVESDALGKLFIAGTFIRMVGGPGALGAIGMAMGRRIGGPLSSTVAGQVAGAFGGSGTIRGAMTGGRATSAAKAAGRVFGVAFIGAATVFLIPEAFKLGQKIGDEIEDAIKDPIESALGKTDASQWIAENFTDPREGAEHIVSKGGKPQDIVDAYDVSSRRAVVLYTQAARRMGDAREELERFTKTLGFVDNKVDKSGRGWSDYADRISRSVDRAVNATGRHSSNVDKDTRRIGLDFERAGNAIGKYATAASRDFGRTTKSSQAMDKGVSRAVNDMVAEVSGGITDMGGDISNALKELGVSKGVNFAVSVAKDAAKNTKRRQHGGSVFQVPGEGTGDSFPMLVPPDSFVLNRNAVNEFFGLQTGGMVPVVTEPKELVFDPAAVQAMGGMAVMEWMNREAPRFQEGGSPRGRGPGGTRGSMSAMVSLVNRYERASYPYLWGGGHGGFVNASSPVDCSGFVSDVLHAGGLLDGAPMVSGSLASWGKPASGNEPLVVYANPEHTLMKLNGRYAGTSSTNPGGGAGWLSEQSAGYLANFAKRTMNVSGAVATEIARRILRGPAGAFQSAGQGGLDRVHKAANAYLARQMPMGAFGGGQPLKDLPLTLQRYNQEYPEAPAPSHLSAPKMPFNAVAALAEWVGTPGWSMATTAIGESALAPGASGIDPGGTKGLGLWMITTGYNDALIKRLGGQNAMFNPVVNAQAMKSIYDAQGLGAWYSKTKDTSGRHYTGSLLDGPTVGESGRGGRGRRGQGQGRWRGGPLKRLQRGGSSGGGIRWPGTTPISTAPGPHLPTTGGSGEDGKGWTFDLGELDPGKLGTAPGSGSTTPADVSIGKVKPSPFTFQQQITALGIELVRAQETAGIDDDREILEEILDLQTRERNRAERQLENLRLDKDDRAKATRIAEKQTRELERELRKGGLTGRERERLRRQRDRAAEEAGRGILDRRRDELLTQLADLTSEVASTKEQIAGLQDEVVTELTDAMSTLADAINEQNRLAARESSVQNAELVRAIADLISGEIGGRVTHAQMTAGYGSVVSA